MIEHNKGLLESVRDVDGLLAKLHIFWVRTGRARPISRSQDGATWATDGPAPALAQDNEDR
jgi:hypothetical protein